MGQGEGDKSKGFADEAGTQHHQYGTFQGVSNYPPPQTSAPVSAPVTGFPQPSAPPGVYGSSAPYYSHGYQAVPVYGTVAEGRPVIVRQRPLPCCGCGFGWFLFIIGFLLGALPWYLGMIIMIVGRIDHREKPGYIACTIAAILATIAVILGVYKGAEDW